MTSDEIKMFFRKVKVHYPEFRERDHDVMREWTERLTPYSKEDIYAKFEEHLNNEYLNKEVPKVSMLTKWLIPEHDKKRRFLPVRGSFHCRWCGGKCNDTKILAIHEEGCLRKRFVSKMFKKLNINPEEFFRDFERVSLEELDNQYDKIILRIIDEENKQHKLNLYEKEGIKAYYQNAFGKGN